MAGHNLDFQVPPTTPTEMRLLYVSAAPFFNDPVNCDLVVHSQETVKGKYEALSYVWGNLTDQFLIRVNEQPFRITENLDSALRHLRHRNRVRILWVDAISLNQNDIHEKNLVVPRMHLIYKLAKTVSVWLGPADQDTRSATELVATMAEVNEDMEQKRRDGASDAECLDILSLMQSKRRLPGRDELQWSVLKSLYSRDWWSRVWTLQEAAFAQNYEFRCGFFSISGQQLEAGSVLVHTMSTNGLFANEGLRSPGPYWQAMQVSTLRKAVHGPLESQSAIGLDNVLAIAQAREATDSRDHFYGCFNLANIPILGLGVDYSKNASEVFEDATKAMIENARRAPHVLNLLAACSQQDGYDGETQRPSWVVDLERKRRYNTLCKPFGGAYGYAAAGDSHVDVSYSTHTDGGTRRRSVLTVRAMLVDEISSQSAAFPPPDLLSMPEEEHNVQLQRFYEDASATVGRFLVSKAAMWDQHLVETFHRTLVIDRDLTGDKISAEMVPISGKLVAVSYAQNMHEACWKRRFFMTRKGYMGLAPHVADAGDHVFIVAGCDVPLIMRRVETGSDCENGKCYVVVGDAYVHGLMQGEALKGDGHDGILNFNDIHLH